MELLIKKYNFVFMKIISGKYKNRGLFVPKDRSHIRMTTGLVRKVIADIFREQITGAVVLELFAGIGSVGLELLSNGAKKVIFAEINKKYCDIIRKNCEKMKVEKEHYSVIPFSYERALQFSKNEGPFGIVYLDPPYADNLVNKTIQALSDVKICDSKTIIIAEHHFKEKTPDHIGDFRKTDSRKYGMTVLDFFMH
ncbi:MAG: 16S rRNA (guanine(966)-N(2))-methyltransferase RsmD [Spirochaetes bacterium]|nr:16S rRNA (guanine(966)-N(2))-methyltransferase RsmD [Spirochaetota bacterium]